MKLINYCSLMIGLKNLAFNIHFISLIHNHFTKGFICIVTVNPRFTFSEKIQIRTVYHKYFFHKYRLSYL